MATVLLAGVETNPILISLSRSELSFSSRRALLYSLNYSDVFNRKIKLFMLLLYLFVQAPPPENCRNKECLTFHLHNRALFKSSMRTSIISINTNLLDFIATLIKFETFMNVKIIDKNVHNQGRHDTLDLLKSIMHFISKL